MPGTVPCPVVAAPSVSCPGTRFLLLWSTKACTAQMLTRCRPPGQIPLPDECPGVSQSLSAPHLHHNGVAFAVSNGQYRSLRNGC